LPDDHPITNYLIGLPVDSANAVLANRISQAIDDTVKIRKKSGVASMDHISKGHIFSLSTAAGGGS
jgi:hypothetical protein